MKDRGPFNIAFLSGIAIGFAWGIFVAALTGPWFTEGSYCPADKPVRVCWTQYLDVTGGWIAFVASAAAAFIVYRQFDEMRKQTTFQLGNELPVSTIVAGSGDEHSFKCTIVNWNRRPFRIESVTCLANDLGFDINKAATGDWCSGFDSSQWQLERPLIIKGTVENDGRPETIELTLFFPTTARDQLKCCKGGDDLLVLFDGTIRLDKDDPQHIAARRRLREVFPGDYQ